MPSKRTTKESWWKRLRGFLKTHTGLTVIITAALLLELTTGVLYYSAQNIIQKTTEQLVERELNGIAMSIRKQLAKVEVAVNNMDWMIQRDLAEPDSMFALTYLLVEHNPIIWGSGISFKPDYYPQKGHWFEPYSIRHSDSTIETKLLGSVSHDYTQREFYTFTMEQDSDHWCEPYLDSDGAHAIVTTYSSAVHDATGEVVAVVGADLSLQWLKDLMEKNDGFKSTRRYLVSREYNLLAGEDGPFFQAVRNMVEADSDHQGRVIMTDENGENQHVFYYPIGGITQWRLICVCSDREIFAPLRHVRLFLLLMVLVGLLLIGFIIWRSSRNLERLRKVNAEKERIGGELRVASLIQQSMLPHNQWSQDDVEICGMLVPAREVGGDLFDYFIRDEKLFFCIGDVSGKGAPSAMVMAVIHALFRSASAHESNPARIMQTINETACQNNDSNMFVTLFIGVLDLLTGHLHYCNAGHDMPLLITPNAELLTLDCTANLPVGVFSDMRYSVQESLLEPNSIIFLYTDGVTEAKNKKHKQFGLQRVKEVLSSCTGQSPKGVLETVTQQVQEFVGDAEQSDDLTMLAIRFTPKQYDVNLDEELKLKNDLHQISELSNFIKSVTKKLNLDKSLANKLRLAVEESVVNVIEYAYPVGTEGDIMVKLISDGHTLHVQIIDIGIPFDPTAKEKADTTLSAEDRQIGGLGILLMRELMDSINYEREDGKNILTLIKKI